MQATAVTVVLVFVIESTGALGTARPSATNFIETSRHSISAATFRSSYNHSTTNSSTSYNDKKNGSVSPSPSQGMQHRAACALHYHYYTDASNIVAAAS